MANKSSAICWEGESRFSGWLNSLNKQELRQLANGFLLLDQAYDFLPFEKRKFYFWYENFGLINLRKEMLESVYLVAQSLNKMFLGSRLRSRPYSFLLAILPVVESFLKLSRHLTYKSRSILRSHIFEKIIEMPKLLNHREFGDCMVSMHSFGRYCERFALVKESNLLFEAGKDYVKDFLSSAQVELPADVRIHRIIDSRFQKALYSRCTYRGSMRFVVDDEQSVGKFGEKFRIILTVEVPMKYCTL